MIIFTCSGEYNLEISNIVINDDAVYECQLGATTELPSVRSRAATLEVVLYTESLFRPEALERKSYFLFFARFMSASISI